MILHNAHVAAMCSQRVHWEKHFLEKFTGEVVSAPQAERAPPPRQSKSPILGHLGDLYGGIGQHSSFSCILTASTKNVVNFFGGKSWLRLRSQARSTGKRRPS